MLAGSTVSATVRDGKPAALYSTVQLVTARGRRASLWPALRIRPRIDRVFGVAARARRGQMGN